MRLTFGGMLAKAPPGTDLTSDGVAVIALVGIDETGLRHLIEQDFTCLAVGDIAACQHEGDRPPQTIGQGVDLGGASTARATYGLIALPPLPPAAQRCARTAEESMSIWAGGPPALANAWKISSHTPLIAQR